MAKFVVDEIRVDELPGEDFNQRGFRSYRSTFRRGKENEEVAENMIKFYVHADKSVYIVDEKTQKGVYLYKQQVRHLKDILKEIKYEEDEE